MKLSTRLGILVLSAGLGLVLIAGVALCSLHASLMEDHRVQIRTLLTLAGRQPIFSSWRKRWAVARGYGVDVCPHRPGDGLRR